MGRPVPSATTTPAEAKKGAIKSCLGHAQKQLVGANPSNSMNIVPRRQDSIGNRGKLIGGQLRMAARGDGLGQPPK